MTTELNEILCRRYPVEILAHGKKMTATTITGCRGSNVRHQSKLKDLWQMRVL